MSDSHKALKISGGIQGRPGRWVCSCGQQKRFGVTESAGAVAADHWEHAKSASGGAS